MENSDGKLLTAEKDIIEEAAIHYKSVFQHRTIKQGYENFKSDRENLCRMRLNEASKNKTPA